MDYRIDYSSPKRHLDIGRSEYTAMLIARKYMDDIGQGHRNEIIVPDSAHGRFPHIFILEGKEA